jgi:uncharacterized protein
MIRFDESCRTDVITVLKQYGVQKAFVFGSVARGEQHKDSDLDILIDLSGRYSLFDVIDIKLALEDMLGCKVDVVTIDSLHPLIKPEIQKEQVVLF